MLGYDGRGDFELDEDGRLTRRREREVAPFVFTATASSPAQLVFHGPDNDDAHSTDATVFVCRFVQTSIPFWLREVMTGSWAIA